MGTVFYVEENEKKIIDLTNYTIDEIKIDSDIFPQYNFIMNYDEIKRSITLLGKILTNTNKEDDDIRKLINWAVLPTVDKGCYKKVVLKISSENEEIVREEVFDKAYIVKYNEKYTVNGISFSIVIKNFEVPPLVTKVSKPVNKPQEEKGSRIHKQDPKASGLIRKVTADKNRTQRIIDFNSKATTTYYQQALKVSKAEVLNEAIYTGEYCLPMDFKKYSTTNFSQGFWGKYSHKGKEGKNRSGAIDVGAGGKADIPLYAILPGKVVQLNGSCNMVKIQSTINGKQYVLCYLHIALKSTDHLKVGDMVEMGARIATVGNVGDNGRKYAIHLDLRVLEGGTTNLDPLRFFDIERYVRFANYD